MRSPEIITSPWLRRVSKVPTIKHVIVDLFNIGICISEQAVHFITAEVSGVVVDFTGKVCP